MSSSQVLERLNGKGRRTDKYCSFPEIMLIALPPPLALGKASNRYIYFRFLQRAVTTTIASDVSASGNTVGGGRGLQLKKKARTIQSLSIRYFRCKMDIRVEI